MLRAIQLMSLNYAVVSNNLKYYLNQIIYYFLISQVRSVFISITMFLVCFALFCANKLQIKSSVLKISLKTSAVESFGSCQFLAKEYAQYWLTA